ncbi:unnamed protein product [Ectocarpus sp. 12 AP-2014]
MLSLGSSRWRAYSVKARTKGGSRDKVCCNDDQGTRSVTLDRNSTTLQNLASSRVGEKEARNDRGKRQPVDLRRLPTRRVQRDCLGKYSSMGSGRRQDR